jgi:hypothetical protein
MTYIQFDDREADIMLGIMNALEGINKSLKVVAARFNLSDEKNIPETLEEITDAINAITTKDMNK